MLAGLWGEPDYACILYNLSNISAMYSEHYSNIVIDTICLLAFIVVFVHDWQHQVMCYCVCISVWVCARGLQGYFCKKSCKFI